MPFKDPKDQRDYNRSLYLSQQSNPERKCSEFDHCGRKVKSNSRSLVCNPCKELRKRYGITMADRNNMLNEQDHCCKVCDTPVVFTKIKGTGTDRNNGDSRRAVVDHCHVSGKVRGVLCHNCNVSLGLINDDQEILTSMLNYLQEHGQ